jgi:pyruvate, orthophosphate dikinase
MITPEKEPLLIGMKGASAELDAEVVGSKAAQLWRLANLGLNVPPAFVMPATLCAVVNAHDPDAVRMLDQGLRAGIARLEAVTARRLGDSRCPLLVSVRSGAAKSMPGMLKTILNVGLNRETIHGLIRLSGNPRLAWDSYRRFIRDYAEVVHNVDGREFEQGLNEMMKKESIERETDLDPEAMERLADSFCEISARFSAEPPKDPFEQLSAAARAVYGSWESARAREYRRLNELNGLLGTATMVQTMVFGNAGGKSGAGVAFTRNPANGSNEFYVDFLFDAQGEDVVSGRRTPAHASHLAARLPDVYKDLRTDAQRLEREFRDVQDVEFTVENGKLYFLQTRRAQCTGWAALRIVVDLVHEGLIDIETALTRVAPLDVNGVGLARFRDAVEPIAFAISASSGVASGRMVLDSARAKQLSATGEPIILVRHDTATEDVEGFAVSSGILTCVGGRTAHAAVVARQLGKVCLVGCHSLTIDETNRKANIGGVTIHEGDWLSLNGNNGEISLGERAIDIERPEAELAEIERWRTELAAKGTVSLPYAVR